MLANPCRYESAAGGPEAILAQDGDPRSPGYCGASTGTSSLCDTGNYTETQARLHKSASLNPMKQPRRTPSADMCQATLGNVSAVTLASCCPSPAPALPHAQIRHFWVALSARASERIQDISLLHKFKTARVPTERKDARLAEDRNEKAPNSSYGGGSGSRMAFSLVTARTRCRKAG